MNKKILSIFALIMAISILGVSCAKDNNTTNPTPTPTTPPISAEDAKKVVNAIAAVGSTGFNLSSAEVTASGTDYKTSVEIAGSANVKITDVISGINTGNMNTAVSGLLTVNADGITVATSNTDKTLTVTIPYTTTKDKKDGKFIISFSFTGNHTFTYEDIAIGDIQGAFDALGTVDSTGGSAKTSDNVTFTSTTIASGEFTLAAVEASSSGNTTTDLALITEVVDKINTSFALTGAKVTAEAPTSNPTGNNAAEITVTITLDNGYKFATDVTTAGVTGGVVTVKITPTQNWAAAA